MSENYVRAIRLDGAKEIALSTQKLWLKERNQCPDTQCLNNAYKSRIEELRLLATKRLNKYFLLENRSPLAKENDNGVCSAFLGVLDKTEYEEIYQDNFGRYFDRFNGFASLSWTKVPDGQQQYGLIVEQKIIHDEKPKNPSARIDAFRSYSNKRGGLEYFLSEAPIFPRKNGDSKFPLLLVLENNIEYPSTRRYWHTMFLTPDKKSFWSGEDEKYLEWSMLFAKTIFQYKNNYFALDTFNMESISILTVERYGDSVCIFNLKK